MERWQRLFHDSSEEEEHEEEFEEEFEEDLVIDRPLDDGTGAYEHDSVGVEAVEGGLEEYHSEEEDEWHPNATVAAIKTTPSRPRSTISNEALPGILPMRHIFKDAVTSVMKRQTLIKSLRPTSMTATDIEAAAGGSNTTTTTSATTHETAFGAEVSVGAAGLFSGDSNQSASAAAAAAAAGGGGEWFGGTGMLVKQPSKTQAASATAKISEPTGVAAVAATSLGSSNTDEWFGGSGMPGAVGAGA
eukprot:UC1_evm1s602